jgi:hypothetical protein
LPASLDAERHRLIARLAHIIEDDLTSRGIAVFDLCLSEFEKEVTSNDDARPIADELWLRKDEQVDVEAEKALLVFAIRELTELRWVPWII